MSKREEYVARMKHQLDEWNEDLDVLEAKVAEAAEPVRAGLEYQAWKARESYGEAKKKLQELRDAGEDGWEDLTDEVDHIWKALKQSINYFKSQL